MLQLNIKIDLYNLQQYYQPIDPTLQNNKMDIEQKRVEQANFSFSTQLSTAIKWIEQKDGIQQQIQHHPIINQSKIDGTLKMLNNNMVKHIQTRDFLIFAFIEIQNRMSSVLTIYYFSKSRGQNQCKHIPTLKGQIKSLQFTYPIKVIRQNKQQYEIKLVLGNSDGFIKIIDFSNQYQIQSFQIDTKSIVDIKIPSQQYFSNHPICFALLQDFNIYVVSIRHKIIVAHFRPTIMMCDQSLSLSIHQSIKYMLQTTKGGYIILWKINQNLYKKLQNQQQSKPKSLHKIYNVFPTSILHAASIQGILWSQFLGDLIVIITKKGVFKIIALNIQQKQQFAILLQYQIQNGHTIKHAKILPKQQCLIVAKQQAGYNTSVIQCIFYSPQLLVTKILRIRCQKMPRLQGFILSKNFRYILIRDKNSFLINFVSIFDQKIKENKKNNQEYRILTY